MLKGRSKNFAPKKGPVRRPGGPSASSSTRPSVERQSQTPAPSLPAEAEPISTIELDKIVEENQVCEQNQVQQQKQAQEPTTQFTPSVEVRPPPNLNLEVSAAPIAESSQTTQTTNLQKEKELKRKSREEDVSESPAKRVSPGPEARRDSTSEAQRTGRESIPTEAPSASAEQANQVERRAEVPAEAPRVEPAIAQDATVSTAKANELKRKSRDEEIREHPAKRASTSTERPPEIEARNTGVAASGHDGPISSISAAPEPQHAVLESTNETIVQAPGTSAQPEAAEKVLPSIEMNERDESRSPSPAHDAEEPRYRYPSPENIARVVESGGMGAGANFGPPGGGALGAAGDLGPPGNMGPPGGAFGAAGDIFAPERTGQVVPMAILNPDGTSGGIIEEPVSGTEKGKKKKKVVRRKKILRAAEGEDDDGRATIDMGLNKARRAAAKAVRKKKKEKRKARDETPSDAEDGEIDPTTMTLTELCKDLKIGKKSVWHNEIMKREQKKKQEATRNRMREMHPDLIEVLDAEDQDDDARLAAAARQAAANAAAALNGDPGPSGTNAGTVATENPGPSAQKEAGAVPPSQKGPQGPQLKVVDGVIVLDEASLQINRQAEGEAERAAFEEIEENEFTRVVTSASFSKKEKSNRWDAAATDMFYKLVGQYGTDFNTISKMFPHRSRRQVKLKFNTEERNNPDRITRYMTNPKKAIEMDQFEKLSGLKLQTKEEIMKELEDEEKQQQEQFDKIAEEKAALDRAKKAEIKNTSEKAMAARRMLEGVGEESDDAAPGPSRGRDCAPASSGRKGKGKVQAKKPRKNKHAMDAGGEEVVVIQSIEMD
ncbi:uncharacterized protein PAC_04668 [Phialocephala subalpina]|uniref:Myb-like domain-containing protein n=1 Tax=Phialocephala subalpina TaxID=576137 RepID=A0A1L7WPT1_9HELO|nr:uncharacterized protein PAC_04668 [Phialocephala subalpina]